MTADNLAILITPCIFRSLTDDPMKELLDTRKLIEVTKVLVNNYDDVFNNLKYQQTYNEDDE
jgi:hypothetical protein